MLLIKNGYMIDPKSGMEGNYDILSENGRITEIAEKIEAPAGCEIIDAKGLTVAPGLIDVHVHFRDPGFTSKEDIITGAAAAKAGGFTTVVMMANTRPTIDSVDTLVYCLEKGATTGIHVMSCANVTCGMMGEILTLRNPEIVKEAMIRTRDLGVPISFHEEDPDYIENNGINHGKASDFYHIGGSDRLAEIVMVERDLALALETGASIEIQHISSKEAVELVRRARAKAPLGNIHAEATPHHFTLTEDAAIRYGSYAKMNPPLREEADRMAIIEGLADGTIDIIATDHAPHTVKEKKERKLTEAPSGIIGLETSLALGITELVHKGHLTMRILLERMSYGPACLYHFDAGYIAPGGPCDLVIFDENEKFTAGSYASKAENSPFTGMELSGRVHMTICGGKVVYRIA